MNKIWVVATTEFGSAVRTKAFLIGILMFPIIMGVSIGVQLLAARQVDSRPKAFAIVDETGELAQVITAGSEVRNGLMLADPKLKRALFQPETISISAQGKSLETVRLELSDRVRKGELFAYVELPKGVLDGSASLLYHSDNPGERELPGWLEGMVGEGVRSRRLKEAGIDPSVLAKVNTPVTVDNLGLDSKSLDGTLKQAEKVDPIRTFVVPGVLMFLLFMVLMSSAPQLMNSVLEEKMSRISEVLLGSVTPFQLMLGKLLGSTGVSLVLASLYVSGAYAMATYYGYADALTPVMFASFVLFLILGVFMFGSLYIAVGAACNELKDAQSLMSPVLLLSMFPVFVWSAILQSPGSTFSRAISLFPPATPYLMLLRMALRPAPAAWEILLSIVLTTLTALACVWGAGKIFRTGLLMQGKAPSFAEMARWIVAK